MRPEDFVDGASGEVEMVDSIFTLSPDPLPPDLDATHELVSENRKVMYVVGQFSDLGTWLDSSEVVLSPLIHRETVDPLNIGMTTRPTLSGIYRCEAGEEPGQTVTGRTDITEAQNYVEAVITEIQAFHDRAELDQDLLCRLHEILLQGARGEQKDPGEFREDLMGINQPGTPLSEAWFVPAPSASIPYALRGLLQYVWSGSRYVPLVNLALIHHQFETTYPLQNGNGRLGHLLVMLALYKWELLPGPYLYPSSYFNADRDAYLDRLLTVSHDGAWTEWISFFVQAIAEQGRGGYVVARELLALHDRYREQYQGQSAVIRELIGFIIEHPRLTEPQTVSALGRSQPTVNQVIRRL